MILSKWIRKFHRWVSIVFTVMVVALFCVQGFGMKPAEWIYLLPLIPLALLMITGLYMFVLPYLSKQRGG